MDIATDMNALRATPASLKFEIEDLSNRIREKRAKLFGLKDKRTQVLVEI